MSGCNVCLYGVDDNDNEFEAESTPTARAEHLCGECGVTIAPRQKYNRITVKSGGKMSTWKTCALCAEVRDLFYCGNGYYFGQLWEDMRDQAFPNLTTASKCFAALSPPAKTHVMDRWRVWKGLA